MSSKLTAVLYDDEDTGLFFFLFPNSNFAAVKENAAWRLPAVDIMRVFGTLIPDSAMEFSQDPQIFV